MDDLRQSELVKAAIRLAGPIRYMTNIINTVLFAVVIYILNQVFEFGIDIYTILIFFGLLALYLFGRDIIVHHQVKKEIESQYEYLKKEKPEMGLFIPTMGQNGMTIFVRKAALYTMHGDLYMDIFPSRRVREDPEKKVTAVAGKDFLIKKVVRDLKKACYHIHSTVGDREYDLIIPLDDQFAIFVKSKMLKEEIEQEHEEEPTEEKDVT